MFGLGKKKSDAPVDRAAAIKKAAAKGIFLEDVPTPAAPAPSAAPVAVAEPVAQAEPAPKAAKSKAAKPAAVKPEPTPAPKPVAPKPVTKPAANISFSNGEPYVQFARRRPGANMKAFLDMAKQFRSNG